MLQTYRIFNVKTIQELFVTGVRGTLGSQIDNDTRTDLHAFLPLAVCIIFVAFDWLVVHVSPYLVLIEMNVFYGCSNSHLVTSSTRAWTM